MKKSFLLFIFLFGCGGLATITETEKGFEARYKSETKEQARRIVTSEAQEYCEKKKQRAVFKDTKVDYYGSLRESEYLAVKKTSQIGSLLTPVGKVDKSQPIGDILTDDCGYEATAIFTCK